MYSYDGRVRFSEADKDGYLRLEGILDYFQDCSTFQSEDLKVGMEYLAELHMVWVLSSWQIVVERYPKMGERITIGTVPYEIKGCFGHRNYMIFDEKGERIACAMESRGLGRDNTRTFYKTVSVDRTDWIFLIASVVLYVILAVILAKFGLFNLNFALLHFKAAEIHQDVNGVRHPCIN